MNVYGIILTQRLREEPINSQAHSGYDKNYLRPYNNVHPIDSFGYLLPATDKLYISFQQLMKW